MNPFELHGPEFLVFYAAFAALVIICLVFWRHTAEAGDAPSMNLADPYLIAYLRGGEREALAVALVSLIDRGLLVVKGSEIERARNAQSNSVRRPIERALLDVYSKPATASWMFEDSKLKSVCDQDVETLKRAGLLPDEAVNLARLLRQVVGCLILGGVGFIKVMIGLQRDRPVGFLVFLTILALVIMWKVSAPRLTTKGATVLADVQSLYSGLKDRAASIRPGGATLDAAMLAAAFGTAALAGEGFAYAHTLFPRAKTSSSLFSSGGSSCGSSCSSGSSCGSSCGGGGCGGGCGGCGS